MAPSIIDWHRATRASPPNRPRKGGEGHRELRELRPPYFGLSALSKAWQRLPRSMWPPSQLPQWSCCCSEVGGWRGKQIHYFEVYNRRNMAKWVDTGASSRFRVPITLQLRFHIRFKALAHRSLVLSNAGMADAVPPARAAKGLAHLSCMFNSLLFTIALTYRLHAANSVPLLANRMKFSGNTAALLKQLPLGQRAPHLEPCSGGRACSSRGCRCGSGCSPWQRDG